MQVQVGSSPFLTSFLAGQVKPKPKTSIDLFDDDDDEEGDIFGAKYSVTAQNKKGVDEEQIKPPEKKVKNQHAVYGHMCVANDVLSYESLV